MKISVLMSCYKNDDPLQLKEAFISIVVQTRAPDEVVLVIDGKIGQTLELAISECTELAKQHGVVSKLHRLPQNLGLGLALYEGSLVCAGDYIVRMDSDDISIPQRIELLSKYLHQNPDVDVVGAQIEEFYGAVGDLNRRRYVPLTNSEIQDRAKKFNPMNHVTVCIKKSSLMSIGSYEGVLWHEDYFLWIKFIMSGCVLQNLPEVHVFVRVSELSDRRGGIDYLKQELNFLKRGKEVGFFSMWDCIRYIIPRIPVRLGPKKLTNYVYTKLRS